MRKMANLIDEMSKLNPRIEMIPRSQFLPQNKLFIENRTQLTRLYHHNLEMILYLTG